MNEKLTLQDLTDKLAARVGVTKKVSDDFLREFFLLIVDSLEKDGLVKIKGLGTFKLKSVEERKSVSVQTGAEMVIPAHVKVSYTPDKGLSSEINKPYAHLQTYILGQDGPVEDTSYVDEDASDGVESDKIDNTIFLNSGTEDAGTVENYYFNDEEVLVDQCVDSFDKGADMEEKTANGGVVDLTVLSSQDSLENRIPSILEAQPQEGQVVTVFTETESVIGTPVVNPGPVVTLISDGDIAGAVSEKDRAVVDSVPPSLETSVPESEDENLHGLVAETTDDENDRVLDADEESSQSSPLRSENTESAEIQTEVEDSAEVKEVAAPNLPVNDGKKNRRTANWAGTMVFFCIFLLLGLVGYLYRDELKLLLGLQPEKEVVVSPPVVETPDVPEEGEPIYDDMSDARISGGVIQHNDEGALDDLPVTDDIQYSFAPELVQYMKENYPNEDISISGIKDEVSLTSGRRLVDLSLRYYGHKYFWVYIYFFNTDVIRDPNKLVPGTLIKVPELSPSLTDKESEQKLEMAFEIKKIIEK